MKFQVRVLSGLRPDKKLFRDAEQIAMLQYARSNTIDSEWRREGEVRELVCATCLHALASTTGHCALTFTEFIKVGGDHLSLTIRFV